jgi:hypothetical protein
MFRKFDLFTPSGESRQTPTLLGSVEKGNLIHWTQWLGSTLSKGPNRISVFVSSSEDGNRSYFRKVTFPSYLEFRTMAKVQKPSDYQCYKLSLEPFRFCNVASFHKQFTTRLYFVTMHVSCKFNSVSDYLCIQFCSNCELLMPDHWPLSAAH